MTDRYFVEQPIKEDHITLSGPEAHHLTRVMRAAPGTEIILFDGQGAEFLGRVDEVRRNEAAVTILERHEIDRELPRKIILGVALPKGDRQKFLVEKATELGVAEIVPLVTRRGVAQPSGGALERLARGAIEAAKQCRRNRLLHIAEPLTWSAFVTAELPPTTRRWLAHPDPDSPGGLTEADLTAETYYLAIGPEGGLTDEEVQEARNAGWEGKSLGTRILRVETAAIALAAAIALRGY